MSQEIERIARLETLLEDNNKAIHHIEEALFGNGKPGLISDFRLLSDSVNRHHKASQERIRKEEELKKERKTDWKWVVTTIIAIAAVITALFR